MVPTNPSSLAEKRLEFTPPVRRPAVHSSKFHSKMFREVHPHTCRGLLLNPSTNANTKEPVPHTCEAANCSRSASSRRRPSVTDTSAAAAARSAAVTAACRAAAPPAAARASLSSTDTRTCAARVSSCSVHAPGPHNHQRHTSAASARHIVYASKAETCHQAACHAVLSSVMSKPPSCCCVGFCLCCFCSQQITSGSLPHFEFCSLPSGERDLVPSLLLSRTVHQDGEA